MAVTRHGNLDRIMELASRRQRLPRELSASTTARGQQRGNLRNAQPPGVAPLRRLSVLAHGWHNAASRGSPSDCDQAWAVLGWPTVRLRHGRRRATSDAPPRLPIILAGANRRISTRRGQSGRPALRNEPNGECSRHSRLVQRIVSERMEKDAAFARQARRKFA